LLRLPYYQQQIDALIERIESDASLSFNTFLKPLQFEQVHYEPWQDVNVTILREDRWHPLINGNKWHKLKFNLLRAIEESAECIYSFGGPYSNHLYALAAAGYLAGIPVHCFVRGHHYQDLTPTLKDIVALGASITFVNRDKYRCLTQQAEWESFSRSFAAGYWVPEGGNNLLGVLGCAHWGQRIAAELPDMDYWVLPVGTGASVAGLSLVANAELNAVSVLKNALALTEDIAQWRLEAGHGQRDTCKVLHEYHHGGYGQTSSELRQFMQRFYSETSIPLDPVYTAKAAWALDSMIYRGVIAKGANVLLIHTGGLQGARGIDEINFMHSLVPNLQFNQLNARKLT